MTRRGFLSSIAAAVASPKVVADAAIATAAAAAIDEQIAAADAKFVKAADDMFFHDLRPELRYSWNRVGILPGEAMACLLMEDLDCYEREGRLAERMDELEAHGNSLQEYVCGKLVEIPLTRRWLEEFRRRRVSEAGKLAKAAEVPA